MFKKQYLAVFSAVVLATSLLPNGSQAATGTKNLQAKYNNIKVLYNGAAVPTTIEPFIVNGTTYIPLRMMAGVFNKEVVWDGNTYTITVRDQADAQHAAELAARDAQIRSLQTKIDTLNQQIADLEDDLEEARNDDDDDDFDDLLSDLEDDLNDDYEDFRGAEWDITLSGDEDEIEVEIALDFDEYEDELDDSDYEDLVVNVIEDIWYEFDDADVVGEIVDTSNNDKKKYDFEGDVSKEDIYFEDEIIN
ncbi:stalk domain-containing protein [Brevibacillus sp. SAFN-007a]|uniref:stalk domain-containing protein n=1 Tax=Brevibacillus sp. SAFN-007a TaxID=3436862 RepID=UPI003F7CFEF8